MMELTPVKTEIKEKEYSTIPNMVMEKAKKHYTSLSAATNDLRARGYTLDFNIKPDCIECPALQLQLTPEKFKVDEFHRFEGMSSTDDNSIVFAISSDDGVKGILVDAYGVYASSMNDNMIRRLSITR